jgi:hypothetical protein
MWRNQQAYRQTANGKAKRRAQSARHRLRKNERRQQTDVLPVLPAVLTLPSVSPATEVRGEGTGVAAAAPVETSGVETSTCCCCEIRREHGENRELFPPAESRVGHQYDPDAKNPAAGDRAATCGSTQRRVHHCSVSAARTAAWHYVACGSARQAGFASNRR